MSERAKSRWELAAVVLGVCAGAWGMIGGLVLLPNRMEAIEKRQEQSEAKLAAADERQKADHELLVRIEERLISVQKHMEKEPK